MNFYPPLAAAFIAVVCAPGLAQAQVLRCEDAKGNITYTNTGCPGSKEVMQVLPAMTEQERAQQEAQYQRALERKREAQKLQAERDAAQRQTDAARAPSPVVHRPAAPVIVQVPANEGAPAYSPLYPPRPPHVRPQPPLPQPPQAAVNCNVFRCYDGKGNTWSRP